MPSPRMPRVTDPSVRELAELLVDRCLDVEPGWQVSVRASPLARPLVREVARRDRPPRRLLPAADQLGPRTLPRRPRLGARGAARAARRAATDRAPPGRQRGRAADDPRARRRPRRRRARPRAPRSCCSRPPSREQARAQPRRSLGGRRVPDRPPRPAGGNDARGVHGLRLRRLPARLGRRGGADGADQGALRPRPAPSASWAKARTSRSGSKAARASFRPASATCPTERSSTARSRTAPKA